MSLSVMQEAAVRYIGQGLAVLPCMSVRMMGSERQMSRFCSSTFFIDKMALLVARKISKASIPPYSDTFITDKSEAVAVFERYPLANIHIATGAASGVVVLDVDFYRKAHKVIGELGLPVTRKVRTGRGEHWYFIWPQDSAFTRRQYKQNFLLGNACRVVLPPSVHFNGKVYSWENDEAIAPLPEMFRQAPKAWVSDIRIYATYRSLKDWVFVAVAFPLLKRYIGFRFPEDQAASSSVPK